MEKFNLNENIVSDHAKKIQDNINKLKQENDSAFNNTAANPAQQNNQNAQQQPPKDFKMNDIDISFNGLPQYNQFALFKRVEEIINQIKKTSAILKNTTGFDSSNYKCFLSSGVLDENPDWQVRSSLLRNAEMILKSTMAMNFQPTQQQIVQQAIAIMDYEKRMLESLGLKIN